eukprot:6963-Heterococcus_DN1.PRE.1
MRDALERVKLVMQVTCTLSCATRLNGVTNHWCRRLCTLTLVVVMVTSSVFDVAVLVDALGSGVNRVHHELHLLEPPCLQLDVDKLHQVLVPLLLTLRCLLLRPSNIFAKTAKESNKLGFDTATGEMLSGAGVKKDGSRKTPNVER